MRTPGVFYVPGFPKGVKWLLISNTAIFIIGFFAQVFKVDRPLAQLVLIPVEVVTSFKIWQLATYMFLHGGFNHILWNMLALWMFGADLEQLWGTRRFLKFYFFCGIGAGLCVVTANYLIPAPWGDPTRGTIGSSGAIYGILLAFAMINPTRTILFMFLFPIQAKYLVMIYGTVAFMMSFQPQAAVSNFAHLGGLLFGYIFMKSPRNMSFDPIGPLERGYHDWKLRRAKKKFQVYLRKQGSTRDPHVH